MSSDEVRTPAPPCAPETLEEELEQIEREQTEAVALEAKETELQDLQRRARDLESELTAARMTRRRRAARAALPVIEPREPCTSAWDDMRGTERIRTCGRCKSRVYDLGGLDPAEARRVLRDHEGRLPSHVIGRVDGTVTVTSCSEKRARLSPLALGLAAGAAIGLVGSGTALGYVLAAGQRDEAAVAEPPPVHAIELGDLVEELAAAKAKAARDAERSASPPPAATPPTPPPDRAETRERAEPRDRPERKHKQRHRSRCQGFGMGIHDEPSPLFYFFESEEHGDCSGR